MTPWTTLGSQASCLLLSINKRKVELRIIYRCDKFKKKILKVLNIPSQAVEV